MRRKIEEGDDDGKETEDMQYQDENFYRRKHPTQDSIYRYAIDQHRPHEHGALPAWCGIS